MEYEILEPYLETGIDERNYSTLTVRIPFKRLMEYHVTNTFLQTLLLIFVGYLSFFFKLDNFTDKIMVTLTTMLVVATIMVSIQAVSSN